MQMTTPYRPAQQSRSPFWAALIAVGLMALLPGAAPAVGQNVAKDAVIVKVKDGYLLPSDAKQGNAMSAAERVREWAANAGAVQAVPLWTAHTDAARLSSAAGDHHPGRRTFIMRLSSGTPAEDAIRQLERLPWVEYAEIDGMVELHQSPNDPLYPRQWDLENTGQAYWRVARVPGDFNDTLASLNGTPGADIRFLSSHQYPGPKTSVPVCIIDTGIDTDHEDLVDHLLVNAGEIPDNGIDDDHNGFVDDVYGYDFSGDVRADTPLDVVPDSNVTDSIGHGTHVAGTVAATVDNGLGIAGVSDSARVFAAKIFPYSYFSVSAQAIYYAVLRGARVINMSWGGAFPSQTIEDALQYASDHGVVLVASMGNSGANNILYPSSYDITIGVGASTADDRLATFSTYNDFVDVIAPGQDILSLRAGTSDLYAQGNEPGVHIIDEHYYIASGTSMAAPHVTGAAAVLLSIAPGLSNTRVREILESTADDIIDPYGDGANLPGWDNYTGWGRINLQNAIAALPGVFAVIDDPQNGMWLNGNITITGSAMGANFSSYSVQVAPGIGPEATTWETIATSGTPVQGGTLAVWDTDTLNGDYTIRLDAGPDAVFDVPVHLAQDNTAYIQSPATGDSIILTAVIVGTAAGPDFDHYTLSATGPLPATTPRPINTFTKPAWDDTLGLWELSQIPPGDYWIRLSLSTAGAPVTDSVRVSVKDVFQPGWPATIPANSNFAMTVTNIDGVGGEEIILPTQRGLFVLAGDSLHYPTWDPTAKWPMYPGWPRDTLVNYRTPPACADLDGDGKSEIIIATATAMHVYSFIGEEYEGWPQPFTGSNNFYGVSVPTVGNLDGKPGLEIAAIDQGGTIRVWHADGTAYQPQTKPFGSIDVDRSIVNSLPQAKIVDLNGDNRYELVAVGDGVSIFDGQTGNPYPLPTSNPLKTIHFSINGVAIGDFGGTGDRDIAYVAADDPLGNYFVNVIDGDGNTLPGWPRILEPTQEKYVLYSMAAGDIDDDQSPEIFVAPYSVGGSLLYAFHADGAAVASDSSDGLFARLPGSVSSITLNDIDDDGEPEVVFRVGQLIFGPDQVFAMNPDGSFVPGYPITFGVGSSTTLAAPVIGDINRDGITDMVTLHSTGTQVIVWDLVGAAGPSGRPWPRFMADVWNSGVAPPPPYDAVYLNNLVDYIFFGAQPFQIYEPTDLNCSGFTDAIDLNYLIDYLFFGGPPPCVP